MSKTRGIVLAILVTVLLGAGLFLAYDASKHNESRYDVSITQEVQAWDAPGLDGTLRFVSEFTNFYPGLAIWTAVVAIFIWRGLRVEALVLLMAVVTFAGAEALGVLVDRPRPSSQLVHVSEALIGNGFPSGHVFAAVVFYGLLVTMILRRTRMVSIRVLAPVIGLSIVILAGVARVYLGVHWTSDVLGGFFLGSAALGGLLWVYAGLSAGCLEFLGLEFRVKRLGSG